MHKKIRTSLLVFFTVIGSSFGQADFRNGFIVNLDYDTIQGMVDYRSNTKNYESCIFRNESGQKEYYPSQIIGFGFVGDKYYSSQIMDGTFVEVLIEGDMSLYKSRYKYHVKKDTARFDLESIIEKIEIDGKIGKKEKSKWRGILTYLIGDCLPNPSGYTSSIKLDEKDLAKLVTKYNKCKGSAFTEFKASKPWTKLDFGATLGVARSEITTDASGSSYMDKSYNSIDPTLGILVAISSPRITEKIAFQAELHFLKSSFSSLVELTELAQFHDTFIDLTSLSIPFSIKYNFPEKKYGFYIQGGISYEFNLSSSTRLQSEHISDGNVVNTLPESTAFVVNTNQFGYWGGIGIRRSYQNFKGSLAIRYLQTTALNKTDNIADFSAKINRVTLSLILFKK